MIMMVIGEVLNFVAYAFTEAILVTPMGALSVVVCAIMSHFFLKESLTFFVSLYLSKLNDQGWIGCTLCIIGATILALNAPEEQSVTTIEAFKWLFLAPGYLVWMCLCIAFALFMIFYGGPRWAKSLWDVHAADMQRA
jgi:magnesium transporter